LPAALQFRHALPSARPARRRRRARGALGVRGEQGRADGEEDRGARVAATDAERREKAARDRRLIRGDLILKGARLYAPLAEAQILSPLIQIPNGCGLLQALGKTCREVATSSRSVIRISTGRPSLNSQGLRAILWRYQP